MHSGPGVLGEAEGATGSNADPAGLARLMHELTEARQSLETLYAALDNVDAGLLILDKDLRAIYSNPVLHLMFRANSTEEIRTQRPLYADMLGAAAQAVAVNLDDYVERRLAWVRSGDPKPTDLTMADGTTLRCHLAVLPGGGRMLIYSNVTDIVRNAQELERLATTDGMTGIYNRRHFMTLANREWAQSPSLWAADVVPDDRHRSLQIDQRRFRPSSRRRRHCASGEPRARLQAGLRRARADRR